MAKKNRKQKQRPAARRPQQGGGSAPRQATPAVATPTRPAVAQILPETVLPLPGSVPQIESEPDEVSPETSVAASDGSARRRVQRVTPAAQARVPRGQVSAAALFEPLDSEEAAIPFDRVPYVPRDLRRVAIMASLMIVLILIAAFVVTRINP